MVKPPHDNQAEHHPPVLPVGHGPDDVALYVVVFPCGCRQIGTVLAPAIAVDTLSDSITTFIEQFPDPMAILDAAELVRSARKHLHDGGV